MGQRENEDEPRLRRFLYPTMPGNLKTWQVRRLTPSQMKSRYLRAFSASMGNHSLSLSYCLWTPEQFEALMTEDFAKEIESIKVQLADRAAFIMHQGLGLIRVDKNDKDPEVTLSPAIASALARIVDRFLGQEDKVMDGKGQFRLVVDGLDRGTVPAEPKAPPQ